MERGLNKILPRRWQIKTSIEALEGMLSAGRGRTGKPLSAKRRKEIENNVASLRDELDSLKPPRNLPVTSRYRIFTPKAGDITTARSKEEAFVRAQDEANRLGTVVHLVDSFLKNAQVSMVAPEIPRATLPE